MLVYKRYRMEIFKSRHLNKRNNLLKLLIYRCKYKEGSYVKVKLQNCKCIE